MARHIRVAAVKMDAGPAPKEERLKRASDIIAEAASAGAQLVVLPELFNTGYEYHENNYILPEPIDGDTITWMKTVAKKHSIHLVGSLMLLDGKDVFNSQILVAPDGRRWRYDKNYPFMFERAYFRDGSEIMVANTDLGNIGMMICWDYAHTELWRRYAGQIDAMIITSSPPVENRFQLIMPDGHRVDSRALGPFINKGYYGKDEPFGLDMDEQARWLGVPVINTTASGQFRSYLPNPRIPVFLYLLFRPDLWRHVFRANEVEIVKGFYTNQTKIINAQGEVIARLTEPEGFVIADVELAEHTPVAPLTEQPEIPISSLTYFFADVLAPALMEKNYREGVRRQWGQKMAPFRRSIRWSIVIALGLVGMLAAILRALGRITDGNKDTN